MKVTLLALLFCFLTSTALGESQSQLFQKANAAYFRGDYAAAISQYKALLGSGISDPDVTFNLATAYARTGQYGQAIRYFERTRRLRPQDEDAAHGLSTARTAIGRQRARTEGEALVQTRPRFGDAVLGPIDEVTLGWLLLCLDVLFFGLLALLRFARLEALRLALGISASLVGVLCAVAGVALIAKTEPFSKGVPAIVLADETPIREGPDPRSQVRGKLREGAATRILDRDGEFVLVQSPPETQGWVLSKDVGQI